MDILNKSKNFFRCVGMVYEKAVKKEPCEVEIWADGQRTGEKVKAECIKGKLGVRTNAGVITFMIYFASKGLDGKDSRQWKMATDMLDLNPEVKGNGNEPDTVVIEGRLEGGLYTKRDGTVGESINYRVSKVSTTAYKEGMEYGLTINMSGCMVKNVPETRMVDGEAEETGRNIMTTYMANGKGEVFPINIVVEEDLVEDVSDAVEKDCTIDATLDVNTITFGVVAKKHGIGKAGRIDTSNPSTHDEYILAGMDVVEEPDEKFIESDGKQIPVKTLWMDPEVVKKAIKMYNVKKDEFAKNGGNKKSGSAKSSKTELNDRKAEYKSKRVGKKKEDFGGFDDDDTPWDNDVAPEDDF